MAFSERKCARFSCATAGVSRQSRSRARRAGWGGPACVIAVGVALLGVVRGCRANRASQNSKQCSSNDRATSLGGEVFSGQRGRDRRVGPRFGTAWDCGRVYRIGESVQSQAVAHGPTRRPREKAPIRWPGSPVCAVALLFPRQALCACGVAGWPCLCSHHRARSAAVRVALLGVEWTSHRDRACHNSKQCPSADRPTFLSGELFSGQWREDRRVCSGSGTACDCRAILPHGCPIQSQAVAHDRQIAAELAVSGIAAVVPGNGSSATPRPRPAARPSSTRR